MLSTAEGEKVGESKVAARQGISMVVMSRILMAAPGIVHRTAKTVPQWSLFIFLVILLYVFFLFSSSCFLSLFFLNSVSFHSFSLFFSSMSHFFSFSLNLLFTFLLNISCTHFYLLLPLFLLVVFHPSPFYDILLILFPMLNVPSIIRSNFCSPLNWLISAFFYYYYFSDKYCTKMIKLAVIHCYNTLIDWLPQVWSWSRWWWTSWTSAGPWSGPPGLLLPSRSVSSASSSPLPPRCAAPSSGSRRPSSRRPWSLSCRTKYAAWPTRRSCSTTTRGCNLVLVYWIVLNCTVFCQQTTVEHLLVRAWDCGRAVYGLETFGGGLVWFGFWPYSDGSPFCNYFSFKSSRWFWFEKNGKWSQLFPVSLAL